MVAGASEHLLPGTRRICSKSLDDVTATHAGMRHLPGKNPLHNDWFGGTQRSLRRAFVLSAAKRETPRETSDGAGDSKFLPPKMSCDTCVLSSPREKREKGRQNQTHRELHEREGEGEAKRLCMVCGRGGVTERGREGERDGEAHTETPNFQRTCDSNRP